MKHLLAATLLIAACSPSAAVEAAPARSKVQPSGKEEVAILAGGCFWGMEHVLLGAPGILEMTVGYAGGKNTKVTYEDVAGGTTGHAESVRVVFDPAQISYADLLAKWYFRGHDPTQLNHQNNDVGTQYRSEIFTTTPAQAKIATEVKARVEKSGAWKRPIVTRIEPATTWVTAESYHQDYLVINPGGYNDHWLRPYTF